VYLRRSRFSDFLFQVRDFLLLLSPTIAKSFSSGEGRSA
jgi:hypothetical protein